MRTTVLILAGALLASPGLAQAQQGMPTAPTGPNVGILEVGGRVTNITGDEARFQRFRDLGDGAFLQKFSFDRQEKNWLVNLGAVNVGYEDQRYTANFQQIGKLKASFSWDQIPLFYSRETRTLFSNQGNGRLTVPDGIRLGIQSGDATLANSIGGLSPFDLKSRRDNASFAMTYTASRDVDLTVDVKTSHREGAMPFAGFIGSSPGNMTFEIPAPIDDRTTTVKAAMEWANTRGILSVAYDGSTFDNSLPALRWDSPIRYTAISGGGAQGQLAWWPSNTAHTVSATGGLKLPGRSRATAFVSFGSWNQNNALLPATINPALAAPALERATAEAEARVVSTNLGFTSRPNRFVALNARYRYYDYDNRTPHFTLATTIVGDNTLGSAHEIEPMSVKRQNLDVDVSWLPHTYAAFKVGYGRETADRTFRIFERTNEDVFRVSADSNGNQYVTLRAKWEYSVRKGEGFEEHLLVDVGEQLGMRHYDVADRNRSRATLMVQVTPADLVGFNASVAAGKDDYENTTFGLRNNENQAYTIGFDFVPVDEVDFNVSYGFEKYTALQYSRTANPAPNPQFNDPTRDWTDDSADKVHTTSAFLEMDKLIPKTQLRFGYDISRSKATYVYGLAPNTTVTPAPVQLPPLKTELQTGTADVRYFLRSDVALGFVYWYNRYAVDDFSLSPSTITRLDLTGALLMGYLYKPYTANSFALRLTYLW
ncbi:MAG: MtrB/PioB family decaheme-associated outer membrane protein [Acidobacteria bacterium]|nr:MtrB/PioB family decaheme-associated outer membrane protein [Acidobacteriota bacterium]